MPYYYVPNYTGIYYLPSITVIGTVPPKPSWLPRVSLSTVSRLQDTASRTTLTQTFVNTSSSDIPKAKYNFPLYESCAVVSFRCHVGKRLIEGIVKEKEQAKTEFQQAVDRGETAGLLEQHRPDVFSTSIGNIPTDETVKVEIEYIMELKHDAELDGLRFTIPTSIAPRYGESPSGLGLTAYPGAIAQSGMKIAVQITMPSNIHSVQSPSHPLAVQLGGYVENVSDDAFNPKHALATLGQTSAELSSDFILIVKCADLSSPRALLEMHPTIPNSKALMVTLTPKFSLPVGQKPEIVFVVDRSGSMGNRMVPLKSALSVFLRSLPVGVKFNICSFGTNHSFLWEKSQPYSAEALEQAQRYVDSMNADFGGTVILSPIKSTISQRYKDIPLEIMVLTDGEVWNSEELFDFISQATQKGDVRLFSLGIGRDVSHALVEGMARVGRGFAQIVADEREGIEGKVVQMLKGALSGHINDYRLEWEGKPSEMLVKHKSTSPTTTASKKKISLFDAKADTNAQISFSKLPDFVVPSVLLAPYKLPPLFPFSRTTAYVILSATTPQPQSVWLRGTTPSGDELELEIAVQTLPEQGQTIHQLAARKILQELEEGIGYLHSGKFGVDKELDAGTFGDWVQREGVRVGIKYGIASKWTSFVAVQKTEKGNKQKDAMDKEVASMEVDQEDMRAQADDDFELLGDDDNKGWDFGSSVLQATSLVPRFSSLGDRNRRATGRALTKKPAVYNGPYSLVTGAGTSGNPPAVSSPRRQEVDCLRAPVAPRMPMAMPSRDMFAKSAPPEASLASLPLVASPASPSVMRSELAARQRTMALIGLQTFEGSFDLTSNLATLLGLQLAYLEGKSLELASVAAGRLTMDQTRCLFATHLVVQAFERKYATDREVWELVVEKAKAWVMSLIQGDEVLRTKADGLVQEALAHAQF